MADKKKGGKVEFDLDNMDDLDWPDFDFDEAFKEPKDDRSPVRKVASSAMKAGVKTVADPARIRRTLTKTMPGAYSDAVGVGFDAASSMKDIFDATSGEVQKTKTDLQRTIRRTLPKIKGSVPDKLGKLLEKLGGEEEYSPEARNKQKERDDDTSSKLNEIMGVKNEQDVAEREIGEARRLSNEVTSRKRFSTQMAAFTSMDQSLRQLRDYNEGIDSRWKRKTLEVQMNSNYLMGDLLETTQRTSADLIARLDAIAKNTGLPEAAKITASEEFGRMNQARLLDHLGKGLYGGLSEYIGKSAAGVKQRVTRTVGDKLRTFRDGARDVGDMSADMIQMQKEARENGQDDSMGSILELAMGAGSDYMTNKYGDKAKAKLGQYAKFNQGQGRVRNWMNNGARFLDEEAGKRNTHDGMKGMGLDMLRSLLHSTQVDGSIKNTDLLQGHMPDNFNKFSNRSLIDIIPGLLSRIHHEAVKIRTGSDDVPMIRYDMATGTFTDAKSMIKRVKGALMNEGQDKYNREGLDKIVDKIDDKGELNPAQRKALSRHLVELNLRRRAFKVKDIAEGGAIHGPGSASDKAAIRDFLRKKHDVKADGTVTDKDKLAGHEADIGSMLNGMNHNFADPTGPIKALIDSGYKEELLAAGILKNEGGRISIDFEKVHDLRLGEGSMGEDFAPQAYNPKGVAKGGGGKGAGNKAVSANTDALNALLNHKKSQGPIVPNQFDYGQMGTAVATALRDSKAANDKDGGAVDGYLDKMDKIIVTLEGLNDTYNSGYQTMVLEEIMDILQDGRQFANVKVTDDLFIVGGKQLGNERGLWKDRAKRLGGNIRGKLSGAKNFIGGKLTGAKNRGTKLLNFGRDKVSQAAHALDNWKGQAVDVFVNGWERAALEARKLESGAYRDKLTGKIIKKLSDIKGEVEEVMADGTTRIVLTAEDIKKGLHDRLGKRVILAGIKNIKDLGMGLYTKVTGRAGALLASAKGMFDKAKDWVWGKAAGLHDVYIQGETKPRLLKFILDSGGYVDAATGNVIKKLSDIKGDVKDLQGNVVLSLDDMRKGLVDQYGEKIKEGWLTALSRVGKGVKAVKDFGMKVFHGAKKLGKSFLSGMKGIGSWGLGMVKGLGSKISNMFSEDGYNSDILKAQLEVQMSILQQVSQLNPKNKKKRVGDSDGDGIIDGSWQDIMGKRNAKKDEKGKGAANDDSFDPKKKGGLLAGLTAALGGLGGKIKDLFKKKEDDSGGIGLDDAADAADLASHGKRWLGKAGRGLGRAGKWVGRGLNKIPGMGRLGGFAKKIGGKFAARGAARLAGGAALRAAGGWAARGLAGAGLVAAGVISAPAMAIIGTVVGVASLAWMAYQWYDESKDRPLQKLRLMQYGWDGKDTDQAKKILAFEEKILKHATVSGGKLDIKAGGDDAIAAMKEFDIDPEKPKALAFRQFQDWFDRRFRLVFSDWMVALDAQKIKDPLPSVDDKLSPETKLTLLAAVAGAGKSSWGNGSPPMEEMAMLTSDAAINAQAAAAKATFEKDAPKKKDQTGLPLPEGGNAKAKELAQEAATGLAVSVVGGTASVPGITPPPKNASTGGLVKASMALGGGVGGAVAAVTMATNLLGDKPFPANLEPKTALDALRTIRMRAYGLVMLNTNQVNAMLYLEWAANKKMKVSSDGSAEYSGSLEELIAQVGPRFQVGEPGSPSYENFKQWLDLRFLAVWKAYVGALKVVAPSADPLMAHETAKPTQQYKLAEAIIGAGSYYNNTYTAVWSIPLSPVLGQQPNLDSSTVADNMKAIIGNVEKNKLDEQAGEKGGIKSSLMSGTKDFFTGIGDSVSEFFGGSKSDSAKSSGGNGGWFDNLMGRGTKQAGGELGDAYKGGVKSDMNNGGGDTYSAQAGGGVGAGNYDPNGGPGGNVNDLPLPTGPKGFEEHKDLIAAVAKMTGMDPAVLAGLMATESGFNSGVKNSMGSATGLGQFISGTWKSMISKYGKMFGIGPNTPATDARANALMTVMYMKDNAAALKKSLGRDNFTDVDLYNAHFLGAGGYAKAMKNLDAVGPQLMPKEAANNPNIFWVDGDRNRPRTMRQILALQGAKQVKNRNKYGQMMNTYLASRGEKVNTSLLTQQEGVDPLHGDQGPLAPTTMASNGPNPDASAMGTGPDTGGGGEQPKAAVASLSRQVNAGGADISAGPAQPPELLKVSNPGKMASSIAAADAAGGGGSDPGAQSQQMAQQASAQTTSAANLTGGAVDKLVEIGGQQLEVQKLMLKALNFMAENHNSPAAGPQQAGPMSVRAPQSV